MKHLRLTDEEYMALKGRVTGGQRGAGLGSIPSAHNHSGQARLGRALEPAGRGPVPSPTSPYKSTWEARYAQHLDVLKAAGAIVGWWYEPVRFRLPGKRNFYKADFLVQRQVFAEALSAGVPAQQLLPTLTIEIHEVKGWSKNRRESVTKLKTAAGLNQWAIFRMVEWDRKTRQWTERVID